MLMVLPRFGRDPMPSLQRKAAFQLAVHEIAESLVASTPQSLDPTADIATSSHPGLVGGAAGVALFLGAYAKHFRHAHARTRSRDLIGAALEQCGRLTSGISFAGGPPGVAWSAIVLEKALALKGLDTALRPLDKMVTELLHETPMMDLPLDYLDGVSGTATYLLRRPAHAVRPALRRIAEILVDRAQNQDETAFWTDTWRSPANGPHGTLERVNLGVARGMVGIAAVLRRMQVVGVGHPRGDLIVTRSMNYLAARGCATAAIGAAHTHYPPIPGQATPELGWCWGEPGLISVLDSAGLCRPNSVWSRKRRAIALAISASDAISRFRISDASLCHGHAGVAHLVARARGERRSHLLDAADRWLAAALENRHRGPHQVAGFTFNWDGTPRALEGFLRGVSGVGLALLNRLDPTPLRWDDSLLIA